MEGYTKAKAEWKCMRKQNKMFDDNNNNEKETQQEQTDTCTQSNAIATIDLSYTVRMGWMTIEEKKQANNNNKKK